MKKWLLMLLIVAVFVSLPFLANALEVPKSKGMVTDYAGMLTGKEVSALEQKLRNFERQTSNEIAILIIPSLKGENLEEFSLKVATTWGVGKKKRDNGILLFIVKEDRKMRIEVGYGLEGVMPDGAAGYIIRNDLTPNFKKDEYYKGIDKAIDSLAKATSKEFSGEFKKEMDMDKALTAALVLCVIGAIVTIIASLIHWVLGGFVCGLGAMFTFGILFNLSAPWWVAIFIIGFLIGAAARVVGEAIAEGGGGGGGGFFSSGGSGDSGGGFGGGSFGGGGSSGSW
ncbi:MAG: TPM domain-containing protein [Nanoarchaeota archaeon]|nr:TPM domain-containing protein [Nanoarchaeota archaeon]